MMLKPRSIIFILAFALLLQNTCPFGAAGKSTVALSCMNCPMHHSHIVIPGGQKNLVADFSSIHFPLYVFAVPKTIHTFQLDPLKSMRFVLADNYKDISPEELLRPPRA
jgi:hypothetical protein